jgi:putative hydrolase of the HAD superfamily
LTCEALSTEPNRCLYVGDGGSHELSGAVAVGMDAILLRISHEASLDPYRPDATTWTGRVVESLGQVLPLAQGDRRPTRR